MNATVDCYILPYLVLASEASFLGELEEDLSSNGCTQVGSHHHITERP